MLVILQPSVLVTAQKMGRSHLQRLMSSGMSRRLPWQRWSSATSKCPSSARSCPGRAWGAEQLCTHPPEAFQASEITESLILSYIVWCVRSRMSLSGSPAQFLGWWRGYFHVQVTLQKVGWCESQSQDELMSHLMENKKNGWNSRSLWDTLQGLVFK